MAILGRLLRRLGLVEPLGATVAGVAEDSLVEEPKPSATQLGGDPRVLPWSVGRLLTIIRTYANEPAAASLRQARLARQCLSQFWLVAPVDQLELLYGSAIGECYRELLAGPLAREPLLPQEQAWRDQVARRLLGPLERPETANLLLAVFAYFPPGRMRVENPLTQVPRWLQEDYARLFDPELLQRIWRPAGLLAPAGQALGQAPSLGMGSGMGSEMGSSAGSAMGSPAAGSRPSQLGANQETAALLATLQSDAFQNRMAGLMNLHVIDPADAEVAGQLAGLRRQLAQVWLDAATDELEPLYLSRFGDLYRNLLASGFARSAISPADRNLRRQLAQRVADMSRPGAINALLAVLPYYPPGTIAFGGGEQHMPLWLVREITRLDPGAMPGKPAPEPAGEPPAAPAAPASGETPAR
jgi:hypothetical protein